MSCLPGDIPCAAFPLKVTSGNVLPALWLPWWWLPALKPRERWSMAIWRKLLNHLCSAPTDYDWEYLCKRPLNLSWTSWFISLKMLHLTVKKCFLYWVLKTWFSECVCACSHTCVWNACPVVFCSQYRLSAPLYVTVFYCAWKIIDQIRTLYWRSIKVTNDGGDSVQW